ncbi:MAG TPA: hypothetical protein EYP57_10635 [Thermodesulfobacteriaceae bacterium]|nr:hypothetical protein [Thermodesulfobacteriaceae bacterium]
MPEKDTWTKKDILQVAGLIMVSIVFSVRKGPPLESAVQTLRMIAISVFYGIGTVLIIVGMTKKMFKYNPSRKQIIKWGTGLAAFFAVSQFLHELFLYFSGVGSQ